VGAYVPGAAGGRPDGGPAVRPGLSSGLGVPASLGGPRQDLCRIGPMGRRGDVPGKSGNVGRGARETALVEATSGEAPAF